MGCCCSCVDEGNIGYVTIFDKFQYTVGPGLQCIPWPFIQVSTLSLKVQQMDVRCETKTKDNVFVTCTISVQYKILQEKAYEAKYKMSNLKLQMTSYVNDVIRSALPKLDLDQVFESKHDIAVDIQQHLGETMKDYGYQILQALVTDIDPDIRVKQAMNENNASRRLREAASNKAEADKILMIKAAEADAEAKYWSGSGVAKQRQAIIAGLQDSISEFSQHVQGSTPKDVMNLLLLTQYFDMIREVGIKSKGHSLFLEHSPEKVAELQKSIRMMFPMNAAKK